ncbi:RDD family protein [Actinoallomurus purpureus]|uniref:RDD family protein n=1 Tax=Actinoallomurus purpureus TaxID=478114 RepID=UPI0020926CC0|nr:RDD family protein [Actinoallomurus purpureus]MCO6004865.1 RDD family protein [Actinoallomurus purpureus]
MPVELVTGEAVALDIRVARLASRALALFIDVLLQLMVLYFCMIFVGLSSSVSDSAVTIGLAILMLVGVLVGYPTITETLTRGRTVGKLALGLRVVADDGGPERFRQALVRALAGFIEFWTLFGSPALIASLVSPRGKRLGDIFAGTIVIQDRVPVNVMFGPVAIMPPQLAPWAASLELSRLPDTLALAARQYLTRFWELAPRVRDEMGQRLTEEVLTYISPPPPAGFRPEIYLSAVLAERRHREERRLAERAARRAAIARRGMPLTVSVPPGPGQHGGPAVITMGGPPPSMPSYGGGPMPVPEWLGGAPGTTNPPRFLPPTG